MEDALAHEQALEQRVLALLNDTTAPILDLLQAFDDFRTVYNANTIANFEHAEARNQHIWEVHQLGRRFFSGTLKSVRKTRDERAVETRQLIKAYLMWIKGAESAYRNYIQLLNSASGGIPELEKIAQKVKSEVISESSLTVSQPLTAPELQGLVLASCHTTLIHLGDLSRYRANDKLDKTPDFGRAIGYYGLADTLRPISGIGHHQQAMIHLEQKTHLRAVYELYRSLAVDEPHPAAAQNLKVEFIKVNSAWEKGELIPNIAPNDPEAPKRILTGWFVRYHALAVKGEDFSSRSELERELLAQLVNAASKDVPKFEEALQRMVMINMAAQYHATSLFQGCQGQGTHADRYQQAFYFFFNFNLLTFTSLLQVFAKGINHIDPATVEEDDLASKLTPTTRRVLPALRMYSAWLTSNVHLITGLARDDFLSKAIDAFWTAYADAVGILSDKNVFGVWALDEYGLEYMLPEDVDTIGFKPLQDEHQTSYKIWCTADRVMKPRFSDSAAMLLSADEEMLGRVKGMLDDGCDLAMGEESVPLGFVGGKIYHEKKVAGALAAAEEVRQEAAKPKPAPPPLSYAAAAKQRSAPQKPPANGNAKARHAEMTKMVDSMVEDDEPITPPPQSAVHAPIGTKRDGTRRGTPNAHTKAPSYQPDLPSWRTAPAVQPPTASTQSTIRKIKDPAIINSSERLQAVSGLWNGTSAQLVCSGFPAGLPTGTLSSPPQVMRHGHSRNTSANSIRSRTSLESGGAGQSQINGHGIDGSAEGYTSFSASTAASPMLFGAGGGIWSTGAGDGAFRRTSLTNGQSAQRRPSG